MSQFDFFDDLSDGARVGPRRLTERASNLSEELSWRAPVPAGGHTPETIRALMHDILAEARAATVVPWTPRKLRSHTAMFPYMAEWLKNGEGDQLMLEFKAEMDRLDAPADQVAPNWRRIWGIAA